MSRKGISGAEEIKAMMAAFRNHPPKEIGGEKVTEIRDYRQGFAKLPAADVLQFFTEAGSKITVRPSGTEPKIKFYFGLKCPWQEGKAYAEQDAQAALKVEKMKKDLGI